MTKVDLVVVFSPVGGGHRSAALATAEAARARGLSVEVVDAFAYAPRWLGEAYKALHVAGQSSAPELYGRMYFAANDSHGTLDPLRRRVDAMLFSELERYVESLEPRAVVATHHLPLVVLGRARRKGRLEAPVVGVVTDYTTHACWAEEGIDAWSVACSRAGAELAAHGIASSTIVETGIPVRRAFGGIAPLSTGPDGPTGRSLRVLVTNGGFGVGPLTRIVRSFEGLEGIEVTVVAGRSRLPPIAGARVLGFEDDMAARVAEAHVVVGKAGGLTVTEALSAGRPMIVAAAIPGNEKQNESFVVDGGAGLACEPDAVGHVVERARPSFVAMGERARRLVVPGAADRVVDLALGVGARSGWRAA